MSQPFIIRSIKKNHIECHNAFYNMLSTISSTHIIIFQSIMPTIHKSFGYESLTFTSSYISSFVAGKSIPSVFPFGVLHKYQGKNVMLKIEWAYGPLI